MKKLITVLASIVILASCSKKEKVEPQIQTITNTVKVRDTLYVTSKGDTLLKKKLDSLNALKKDTIKVIVKDTLKIVDTLYQTPVNSTLLGSWLIKEVTYSRPGTTPYQDSHYKNGNIKIVITEDQIIHTNSNTITPWIIERNSWAPDKFSYLRFRSLSGDFSTKSANATTLEISKGTVVITLVMDAAGGTVGKMTLVRIPSLTN